MARVYIINHYDEYGPKDPEATLDESRVVEMVKGYMKRIFLRDVEKPELETVRKFFAENPAANPEDINKMLSEHPMIEKIWPEVDSVRKVIAGGKVGSFNISSGWGGLQLHIIELI